MAVLRRNIEFRLIILLQPRGHRMHEYPRLRSAGKDMRRITDSPATFMTDRENGRNGQAVDKARIRTGDMVNGYRIKRKTDGGLPCADGAVLCESAKARKGKE